MGHFVSHFTNHWKLVFLHCVQLFVQLILDYDNCFNLLVFLEHLSNRISSQNSNILQFGRVRCNFLDHTTQNFVEIGKSCHYSVYYVQ